ncbi:MAG: sodium/glutamate symporter [Balneolaceae bacterium]|nr:sodium/glutamate symporter [Balneolaceae bacterium]
MGSWTLDISAGEFFLDFAWMGVLLVIATYLRSKVSILQKYLIPANLLAGTLGLILGANLLGWIDLTSERLGTYVYHLLALLFIALGLRAPKSKMGLSSVKFGLIFLSVYLVQAIVGLIIAFILIYTFLPDLFAGIGLLPPLAFGMNPGIAYTIGTNWEQFGFASGGIVGLTFSACGFMVAYTVGIWLVRQGIKQGRAAYINSDDELPDEVKKEFWINRKQMKKRKLPLLPRILSRFHFISG